MRGLPGTSSQQRPGAQPRARPSEVNTNVPSASLHRRAHEDSTVDALHGFRVNWLIAFAEAVHALCDGAALGCMLGALERLRITLHAAEKLPRWFVRCGAQENIIRGKSHTHFSLQE